MNVALTVSLAEKDRHELITVGSELSEIRSHINAALFVLRTIGPAIIAGAVIVAVAVVLSRGKD